MSKQEALLRELEAIPEAWLDEVLEFVRRLKVAAALSRSETALASEHLLAREWLRPEEDEAWRDL